MKVGIVGFGFMGRMHFRCWSGAADASVGAICEADPNVVSEATRPSGNIAGAAEKIDLTGIAVYTDYDELLADKSLDAVSITLPSFLHADFTVKALEAGLHVLCEKPMALTLEDCDRMVAAARASGKTLMIGHCIRFWPEYAKAAELIRSGEFGEVRSAMFRRYGAAPKWSARNWFLDKSKSGGMPIDLHVHDTDFVQYVFGTPKSVRAVGTRLEGGMPGHIATHYDYGDDKTVFAEGSWMMMPSFGFEMSFTIAMEKATLVFAPGQTPAFRVCPAEGDAFTPELAPGDGYSREIAYFADVVAGRTTLSTVTPEQSRETIRMVLAEEDSLERGESVTL